MDYEKLLDRAKEATIDNESGKDRFEVPKVLGHIQGNKTVISNFHQIASDLGRDPEHLVKYILRELAAPGDLKKNALIIGAKVPASRINKKIKQYAAEFVFCKECNKPDTKLEKEDDLVFMKCMACGARHPVKSKI